MQIKFLNDRKLRATGPGEARAVLGDADVDVDGGGVIESRASAPNTSFPPTVVSCELSRR